MAVTPIWLTQFNNCRCHAADEHGGQVLPASAPLAGATHIVLQHQKQSVYSLAVQQHKTTVNSYWLLACVEAKRLLPVSDPVSARLL